jgi:ABC-2 type transport system permease protein
MVQEQVEPELAVSIALGNPLQVFRTAAMMLFDSSMTLLGPSAFVILDAFGTQGYIAYALAYPIALGSACAGLGFVIFRRSDLP